MKLTLVVLLLITGIFVLLFLYVAALRSNLHQRCEQMFPSDVSAQERCMEELTK
jgi:hypothetical protein